MGVRYILKFNHLLQYHNLSYKDGKSNNLINGFYFNAIKQYFIHKIPLLKELEKITLLKIILNFYIIPWM